MSRIETALEPDEGPSKEIVDNGFFWIDVIAKVRVWGTDVVCRAKIGSDKGDPAYNETVKVCGVSHLYVYANVQLLAFCDITIPINVVLS